MSSPRTERAVSRRQLLQVGVTSAAAATLLAACGGGGSDSPTAATTTTEPRATDRDELTMRTMVSLELVLIQVYEQAVASGVLSEANLATVELFLAHHRIHATLRETMQPGGQPVLAPNRAVTEAIAGRLPFASEADALNLAYDLEEIARASYVSAAGSTQAPELSQVLLSAAGIDSRHIAVLGALTGRPQMPPSGFVPTTGALAAGTGL